MIESGKGGQGPSSERDVVTARRRRGGVFRLDACRINYSHYAARPSTRSAQRVCGVGLRAANVFSLRSVGSPVILPAIVMLNNAPDSRATAAAK